MSVHFTHNGITFDETVADLSSKSMSAKRSGKTLQNNMRLCKTSFIRFDHSDYNTVIYNFDLSLEHWYNLN